MHKGSLQVKLQKGNFRNKELSTKNSSLLFGDMGIKLQQKGILTFSQINAAKKILAKSLKGIGKLWVRFLPHRPITKKPIEMRMGKGKGNICDWICEIKAGLVLFEISKIVLTKKIKRNILIAMTKLPLKVKFIKKLY